jgi:hypothetical protein
MSLFQFDPETGVSRRRFVKQAAKVGAATTAVFAGLIKADSAYATRTVACCTLLYDDCPSAPCTGCHPNPYTWTCFYAPTGRFYTCAECYDGGSGCAACSYAVLNAGASPPR